MNQTIRRKFRKYCIILYPFQSKKFYIPNSTPCAGPTSLFVHNKFKECFSVYFQNIYTAETEVTPRSEQ